MTIGQAINFMRLELSALEKKMWLGMIMHEKLWGKYSNDAGSKALAITV